MFELVVIWATGEKTVYEYRTEDEADRGSRNMRMALGNQISWCGVRRKTER